MTVENWFLISVTSMPFMWSLNVSVSYDGDTPNSSYLFL